MLSDDAEADPVSAASVIASNICRPVDRHRRALTAHHVMAIPAQLEPQLTSTQPVHERFAPVRSDDLH
jgi:hypothetical protein